MQEILIIIPDDYAAGGLQRSAVAVRNCLKEAGYRVTIFCFKLFPEGLAAKYPFIRALSPDRRPKLLFWLSTLYALRRHIRSRGPHAVISFGSVPSILLPLVSAFLRVPLIVGSERAYPPACPPAPLLSFLRRVTFWKLDFIVCQTEPIKAWFRESLKTRERRLVVIPNIVPEAPVRRPREQHHSESAATASIVAVGRLEEQKGFAFAIEIFSKVVERIPNATLSIAGEGPLHDTLDDQASACGLGQNVKFLGRVRDLAPVWESADLLLFSSLYEGFPNALAEAMANGVPAVSFDCPTGPSELIDSGINGYLVPVGDVERAAECCIDLLNDAPKRRMFAERAAEISNQFSAERVGLLWRQLIDSGGDKPVRS